MKHALLNAVTMIESVLEAPIKASFWQAMEHQIGLKLLLQEESKGIVEAFKNTGIWMVEQQNDRSYQIKMYNGEDYSDK